MGNFSDVDKGEGNKCCNNLVMKRILLLIFLLCYQWSFGQLDFKNSNVGRVMDLADLDGHSLLKKYDPEITGSPFIHDDWVSAKLTLSRGKEIGPLSIKLNIESNELYFLDSTGKEMIAADGLVKKVDCIDYYTKDSYQVYFQKRLPSYRSTKRKLLLPGFYRGKD